MEQKVKNSGSLETGLNENMEPVADQKPADSQGPKWTDEQWEAITDRNCNLLVAAAAGAGKTAVLVERIIRKITDEVNPVDIDRMLIVTFTNAAATEMRERIAEAISKELDKNPEFENIRRQLSLLGKASITTIHSFCKEVIRKHVQNIDLDPGFRVADDTESTLMRLEAMTELFEEQYEKEQPDFVELLECYGGNRNDQVIQDMVMNLYHFIQSSPWPDQWLEEKTSELNIPEGTDFFGTPWGKVMLNVIRLELEGTKAMLSRGLDILKFAIGLEKYIPVFEGDLSNVQALLEILDNKRKNSLPKDTEANFLWDRLYTNLQEMEFARLPNAAKDCDKEKQEAVKELRDKVKEVIQKKIRKKLVTAPSAEILSDLKALYPLMLCLARLVREFTRRYAEKKSRKSILDFNDLEHLCLEILSEKTGHTSVPSAAAREYRERFDEIMVDEYQDSNMVQEIIIHMISRGEPERPNVFMVGDVKQSIYRFRQAKPELFLEKYNTYSTEKGEPFRKILLFKNFRSRCEVVHAVNFIFRQIMSVNAGELDYTDEEALNPGASFPENQQGDILIGGRTEFHLIQTAESDVSATGEEHTTVEEEPDDSEGENEEEEILDNIQCEARLVALRILELLSPDSNGKSFYVFDKGKKNYRRVQFKDIVILLRATKNWSDVFLDELAAMGIPAFADTGTGFFKTIEIQVVLSLLQIIDNPLQDIPLLSVLRSPMFAFTTNELADIRLIDRRAALYDAVLLLASRHPIVEGTETLRKTAEKAAGFIGKLSRWRETALHMSTDQLIWYLYQETGYYGMVGAMPAGEQRQANLRMLYDRARQFEETSYKGLFNFISFIDKLKSSRGDMGSAKILGENDDVVRIMSIHKSKGLEFPVVFLSGCGKRFNLMDMNKNVLLHQELGFGPDVVDHRLRLSRPSAAKLAIRERIRVETLSEEMRILYVALTRAREKLILTGSVRDVGKTLAKWIRVASTKEDKLPDYEMLKASGYLDWIGPSLVRHKSEAENQEKSLLEYAPAGIEYQGSFIEDDSCWSIKIWNKNDVLISSISEQQEESEFLQWLDKAAVAKETEGYWDEVNRRLQWQYSFGKVNRIPAKVTVTELKRRFENELMGEVSRIPAQVPSLVKKPLFLQEKKGLNAAELGTVLHFVMQHLDFSNDDIKDQINRMVQKDLLTQQQAESVQIEKINRFLHSPLGKRMKTSGNVQREVPFNIEIPCHELLLEMIEDEYRKETFLLQGIIDCYFEESDGLVLLDYKTDYVPDGQAEAIVQRYRVQIEYYARTLALLTGKKVKEKYIYLFSTGEAVTL